MNDCAMLSFAMATLMMAFSTLVFCKIGKKTCAEGALLSLVGIGVGFVALVCVYPGFQHMVQHLPVIQNLIGNNRIIALVVDCLAFAGTTTLVIMALCGPLKMKKCQGRDLFKCFAIGIALAFAVAYAINSGCIVKHTHHKKQQNSDY